MDPAPLLDIAGLQVEDWRDLLPTSGAFSRRHPDQVNALAIHHTGGPTNQTPRALATDHVQNKGWAGIGYHFLLPFAGNDHGPILYVGDVDEARANVLAFNHQVIGIAIIGDFDTGYQPRRHQLRRLQRLCLALWRLWGRQLPLRPHSAYLPTACPGSRLTWRLPEIEERARRAYLREL